MSAQASLRDTLSRLRTPISDEDSLISLLSTGLQILGINPALHSDPVASADTKLFLRYLPEYQSALVQHIIPHWLERLEENGQISLLRNYFLPRLSTTSLAISVSSIPRQLAIMECVISAHSTLATQPISQFATNILSDLCRVHTPLDVFCYIFSDNRNPGQGDSSIQWSDYLIALFSIPGRVANAAGDGELRVPETLRTDIFLANICRSFASLMRNIAYHSENEIHQEAASLLLSKLVNQGAFPTNRPLLPSSVSFWNATLPLIRSFINSQSDNSPAMKFYCRFTPALLGLPISAQMSVMTSLLHHLDLKASTSEDEVTTGSDEASRLMIKREALVMETVLGPMLDENPPNMKKQKGAWIKQEGSNDPLWSLVSSLLSRPLTEGIARVLVCWFAFSPQPVNALRLLVEKVIELWADGNHIRHATLGKHKVITILLLALIAELCSTSSEDSKMQRDEILRRISRNAAFITAVGTYIGHPDPSVRRCGMLVAEIVAQRTGGKLSFPVWEGEGEGREWSRDARKFVDGVDSSSDISNLLDTDRQVKSDYSNEPHAEHETNKEEVPTSRHNVTILEDGEDSDDSLEGYDEPTSPRSSSPPLNKGSDEPTIEEINADPTLLNPSRKKIQKPVYLLDLGKLFKVDKEGDEQAESIRIALECAAPLIRKKAGWGLELEENAVNLSCSLMALQNTYSFEDFDKNVLEALTALVACCPRKVAPCIIEHFFTPNYSTAHRFTMLNALALGSRELAGLPTPQIAKAKTSFPSKLLPASSHSKYLTYEDLLDAGAPVRGLVEDISKKVIDAGRERIEEQVPEIVREKQLTVFGLKKPGISELGGRQLQVNQAITPKKTSFSEVAAEYFIMPFVSQFWNYLNESLAREERTARSSNAGYRATGTAMILSPLVLSHFINTMSIMVHAARHSPAFLSVIAPAVLELAVTLGTRKMGVDSDPSSIDPLAREEAKQTASVLSSSLELGVVVLDASIDLDRGKTLALDHSALLSGVLMWAKKVHNTLEGGVRLEGIGGEEEKRLYKASAGLLFKIQEISDRWGQAMLMSY